MAEWDGRERRGYAELREVIREELTEIKVEQAEMRKAQLVIEKKISEWELASRLFRAFIIGTATFIGLVAGAYEWMRLHLK